MDHETRRFVQLTHDRWLIPARQCELPGRDLVHANVLHARREWTFLILASVFLVTTVTLPLFLTGTIVDLGAAELTFGIVMFPIALVMAQLVCELFGAHRTDALVVMGVVASAAVVALAIAADPSTPVTLALALVTYGAVANATNAIVFAAARRAMRGEHLWLRSLVSIATAQAVGWTAFAIVLFAAGDDVAASFGLAATAALFTCGAALALLVPILLVRRVLSGHLRVGPTDDAAIDHSVWIEKPMARRLPPAVIVEEPYEARPPAKVFSTGEMAFFAEGEEQAKANAN